MQSSATECNHLEREEDGSDGDTHRDPIAERDHLWGEGWCAVVGTCMRAAETHRDPIAERDHLWGEDGAVVSTCMRAAS